MYIYFSGLKVIFYYSRVLCQSSVWFETLPNNNSQPSISHYISKMSCKCNFMLTAKVAIYSSFQRSQTPYCWKYEVLCLIHVSNIVYHCLLKQILQKLILDNLSFSDLISRGSYSSINTLTNLNIM